MTKEEVAKRPEFQRLKLTAAAFSSSMRLITRGYGVDLGIIDPKRTCEVLMAHVADELSRREVLAKLNQSERLAIGVALRKTK